MHYHAQHVSWHGAACRTRTKLGTSYTLNTVVVRVSKVPCWVVWAISTASKTCLGRREGRNGCLGLGKCRAACSSGDCTHPAAQTGRIVERQFGACWLFQKGRGGRATAGAACARCAHSWVRLLCSCKCSVKSHADSCEAANQMNPRAIEHKGISTSPDAGEVGAKGAAPGLRAGRPVAGCEEGRGCVVGVWRARKILSRRFRVDNGNASKLYQWQSRASLLPPAARSWERAASVMHLRQ